MKKIWKPLFIFATAILTFGLMGCASDDDSDPNPKVNTNKDGTVTIQIKGGNVGIASCSGTYSPDKDCLENFMSTKANNYDGSTPSIGYVVNTDTAGVYNMEIEYAFGGYCDYLRDAYVYVNGEKVALETENGTLNFDYTIKNWSVYNKVTVPVTLAEGDNSLSLVSAIGLERTITYNSTWANLKGLSKVPDDNKITGEVVSLPNIRAMRLTSTEKNVKLKAGSSTSASFTFGCTSENENYGTVDVEKDSTKYGAFVIAKATPAAGYVFDCWYGTSGKTAMASNDATFEFNITGDTTLKARFIPEDYTNDGLTGYATVADDSGTTYTVTGGTGGQEITIASLEDLTVTYKDIIKNDEPYIIHVAARISAKEWIDTPDYNAELAKLIAAGQTEDEARFILDNRSITFDFGANKTIIGKPGKDYGFHNINPKISKSNVIVKYIHFGDVIGDDFFGGSGNDALSIKGGQHIWIDHCEFSSSLEPKDVNGNLISFKDHKFIVDLEGENTDEETKWKKDFYDGLLDISETSRFVSVSNCIFRDHWKACLCGGSNDKAETQPQGSQVRMTFYRNYFKNIHARQPLFRFGRAHIFSSYYNGIAGESTGIEVRAESQVYVDNCYFENLRSDRTVGCWNSSSGLGEGTWTVKDCTGASTSDNARFTPPYDWSSVKLTAAESKAQLPASAGIPESE